MAGALTANPVEISDYDNSMSTDYTSLLTVGFLSPVDGANNALLTAYLIATFGEAANSYTFQWARSYSNGVTANEVYDAAKAVGPAVTVECAVDSPRIQQVCICAIDRNAKSSGYTLWGLRVEMGDGGIEQKYIDAVLYD